MKALIMMVVLAALSKNLSACVTFEPAQNGKKSDAYVKHFHESFDSERAIFIQNENESNDCEFKITAAELIQKNNGAYQFLDAIPGLKLDRSLVNYMDLKDEDGNSVLGKTLTMEAKKSKKYYFQFNFPVDKQFGSYHGAIKINYPQYPVMSSVIEVYYSHLNQRTDINVDRMTLDNDGKHINYSVTNRGNHYTFFRFEITVQDPTTGFTRSYYVNSSNDKRAFRGYIRNYPLAKDQTETTISSKFRIEKFKQLFALELKKEYPNNVMPDLLILVVLPAYGIDHQSWKNHFYQYLPRQSFTIKD